MKAVTQHTPQPPALADTMTALYTRYHAPIRRFIGQRVHSDDLADDLTQDVFLNAWRTLATFDGRASHATWLFQIAQNAVIDSRRVNVRRDELAPTQPLDTLLTLHLDPADADVSGDPERMALLAEVLREAEALAADIPSLIWSAFALYTAGYDTAEIAVALNSKSAVSAKMLVYRGRKRFMELHRQRQAWRGEETGEASA